MSFHESVEGFVKHVNSVKVSLEGNEEATKTALVLPFLQMLGYNVFDPNTITPEYTADIGTRQGEKVDYAVMQDGTPVILIECKACGDCLDQGRANQLNRYFQCTPSARVGILTDGVVYKFFSDLDQHNIMDPKPFMTMDFSKPNESLFPELRKLANGTFDVDTALSAAQDLKYTGEIKKLFLSQFEDPDDEFVRLFVRQVYSGQLRSTVVEAFRPRVTKALREVLNEMIKERLQSAITSTESQQEEAIDEDTALPTDGVVTTDEEIEGYYTVKAILSAAVDPDRVTLRDTKSYCGVLLDDNNRKPICRLHFNSSQKYLGLMDEEKNETRQPIEKINDIFKFSEELKATALRYDQ